MRLAAFLFVTLGAVAQTAIVPNSVLCPAGQLLVAIPSGSLGTYTILKFSCAAVDPAITIDKTVVPWTLKAPVAAPASVPSGLMIVQPSGGTIAFPGIGAATVVLGIGVKMSVDTGMTTIFCSTQ